MRATLFYILLFVFTTELLAQPVPISIKSESEPDHSISIRYEKHVHGTYTLSVKFDNSINFTDPNYEGIVAMNNGTLFRIKPLDPNRGINFQMRTDMIRGVLNPRVEADFVYLLPFNVGKLVSPYENKHLGEAYFGNVAPKNWKSYNFQFDSSAAIMAARKGQVVEIVDKYDAEEKTNLLYTSQRNHILVEHKDGTFAQYSGFKKNSILVKEGEYVFPHTVLGQNEKKGADSAYQLDFSVFFLNDKDFRELKKKTDPATLFNQRSVHEYLNPIFLTDFGLQKLVSGQKYLVNSTAEIIEKELTKKEKKRLVKE
jgi:hypothetical protein